MELVYKTDVYMAGAHSEVIDGDILRAVQKAKAMGATATQIYLGANHKTSLKEKYPVSAEQARKIKGEGVALFVHGNLTVNLARRLVHRYRWAMDNLVYDLCWAQRIGARGVVVHMGNQVAPLSLTEAQRHMRENIVEALRECKRGKLILENTACEGTTINCSLEELADLFHSIPLPERKRVSVCLDTAHLHGAGYDPLEGLLQMASLVGWKNIALIHLNDSPVERGSQRNQHASLGEGQIFSDPSSLEAFVKLVSEHHIPMVLETRDQSKHPQEVKLLHRLLGHSKKGGARAVKQKGDLALAIRIFDKLRTIYEGLGDQYRARSYATLVKRLRAGRLEGLTNKSKAKLEEIMQTGRLELLERLLEEEHAGEESELVKVIGIGPAKAEELGAQGIRTVEQLRAREGEADLTHEQVLGLQLFDDFQRPISRAQAQKYFGAIAKRLPGALLEPAGSFRMGAKTMKDLDLLVIWPEKSTADILEALGDMVVGTFHAGPIQLMLAVRLPSDKGARHLDIRLIPEHLLPFYLLHFGSGADFSRRIKATAKRQGYKLSEYGLFDLKKKQFVEGIKSEADIFRALGMEPVEPSERF